MTTAERLLVYEVLSAARAFAAEGTLGSFAWTMQGLGLLKTGIGDGQRFRVHVWDTDFRDPRTSDMHDHHWNLRSTVVSGCIRQYRYTYDEAGEPYLMETYGMSGRVGEGRWVSLLEGPLEVVGVGETYEQEPSEVHKSIPDDATVTLVERAPGAEKRHTNYFWSDPDLRYYEVVRRATPEEVYAITAKALSLWSKDP